MHSLLECFATTPPLPDEGAYQEMKRTKLSISRIAMDLNKLEQHEGCYNAARLTCLSHMPYTR